MSSLAGNHRIKEMILAVVTTQIEDNEPPETRQTYERLLNENHSVEAAKQMIGSVVAIEIFAVLRQKKVFKLSRFVKALEMLPKLPSGK